MLKEFKEFIARGNAIDLAIGFVIGAAFTKIVDSAVNDILMPPIGLLLGGADFSNLFLTLKEGATPGPYPSLEAAKAAGATTVNYGAFVNTGVAFLIVAFALFIVVLVVNRIRRAPRPEAAAPPEDVQLLREIRDELRATRIPTAVRDRPQPPAAH